MRESVKMEMRSKAIRVVTNLLTLNKRNYEKNLIVLKKDMSITGIRLSINALRLGYNFCNVFDIHIDNIIIIKLDTALLGYERLPKVCGKVELSYKDSIGIPVFQTLYFRILYKFIDDDVLFHQLKFLIKNFKKINYILLTRLF